jgi:hypothetical protein
MQAEAKALAAAWSGDVKFSGSLLEVGAPVF